MNVVFIVPTGIGCEIGGHLGDATPAAKLIAAVCDKLFIHPNVVNASDINEMTENMLCVEGSILNGFLRGEYGLKEGGLNKILVAVNAPVRNDTINAVSAARATLGADIRIVELNKELRMVATIENGIATGKIENWARLAEQVKNYDFDVLVVNTPIEANNKIIQDYLTMDGGVNPWGGVEAKLSKMVSDKLQRPTIHSPVENSEVFKTFNEVVDPRKAAAMLSTCYLHCCLKGAHYAPKITKSKKAYWNTDIDFLVVPERLFGEAHLACSKIGIPIISVIENSNTSKLRESIFHIVVDNYLEAAGVVLAKKARVTLESVRRPLKRTEVITGGK